MRSMRSIVLLVVLVLAFSACGGDDGDQGGGGHSRRDTAGGDDTGGVDTAADACANGSRDEGESDVDCGGPCAPCGLAKDCVADADCASGYCGAGYTCQAAACANGQQDPGETGVDCGGPCPACLGAPCGADGDCATGYCKGGLCDVPTCADGLKNGRETGVDCGGPDCSQCGDGQGCLADANCVSGYCKAGFCATPTCTDGAANQGESDVDCGGPCPGCALGKGCVEGADCVSGACQGGACVEVAPSCTDGQKNGAETDVDCGGGCPGCGFGKACGDGDDCTSGLCAEGACVAPASCDDGQKNGGEGDVDCGGPCKACATGKYCNAHADCLSITCIYGVCKDPTCADGVKNQGEADVDCAGPCGACADGKACAQGDDCASHYCSGGVCVSCSDGKQNGTETDVDCGGGCGKCGLGKDCTKAGDCQSGACEDGGCCTPNACGQCVSTPQEVCDGKDNDCDGQTDEASQIGAAPACAKQQGVCKSSVSACKGTQGWACDDAVYKAFNGAYQATETTCDAKDNDCDGQTDEGLLNACGKCGVTPSEACNGKDDDCDGQTDELTQCASCEASPSGVDLASKYTGNGTGGYSLGTTWQAVMGDDAWFLFVDGYSSDTHLVRATDGQVKDDFDLAVSPMGSAALLAAGGKLHVGLAGYWYSGSIGYQKAMYCQVDTNGVEQVEEVVADVTNLGGQGVGLDWSGGVPWMAYVTYDAGHQVSKRAAAGSWQYQETLAVSDEYHFPFVVDASGDTHTLERTGYWDDADIVYQGPSGSQTLCDTGCTSSTCATPCTSPTLRKAPDGSVHAVYVRAGSVQHRKLSGSTFGAAEAVDFGDAPGLGFTPDGRPVVSYLKNDSELWVATRSGSTWITEQVTTETEANTTFAWSSSVVVDASGRYHLGVVVRVTDGYYDTYQRLRYVMFCSQAGAGACTPNCTGKQCGSDGCGGSCGTCGAGLSCDAGFQCSAGGCGADPAQTCSSGCGGQGVGGCWCNAQCASYGDCCPDYEACCN